MHYVKQYNTLESVDAFIFEVDTSEMDIPL